MRTAKCPAKGLLSVRRSLRKLERDDLLTVRINFLHSDLPFEAHHDGSVPEAAERYELRPPDELWSAVCRVPSA